VKFRLVGVGEVLWDLLPGGRQMGGAPANFACHASALGAEASLISRVGKDDLGHELIARLEKQGVHTECIEVDPTLPTGTVGVAVAVDGQPRFTIYENVAWDAIQGDPGGRKVVSLAHAVCFGTLAQRSKRSRDSIQSLLSTAPPGALRILDVNFRQNFYSREIVEESLTRANAIKVNDAEWPQIAEMFTLAGDTRAQMGRLAERFNLRLAALTRGAHGSLLFANGCWAEHPGVSAKVVDTVGAGDAFTAAMTLGFLAGWNLEEINRRANDVAAFVCSCAGATPALPATLRQAFQSAQPSSETGAP